MTNYNFSAFGSTVHEYEYVAGLIIYDNTDEILKNANFLDYIDKMMELHKVVEVDAKCFVLTDKKDFIINEEAIETEHELVNQLMFFKKQKLVTSMYLEDLKESFKKIPQ